MASKNKPFPAWKKLEERIWRKYRDEPSYYFLNPKYISLALEKIQVNFSNGNIKKIFKKQGLVLEKIYQDIFKSSEFRRLLKETKKHLIFIENQWSRNEKKALKNLREISGLSIPKRKITVFITHPKSLNCKTLNQNTITRGCKERWKNHSTIFLCHELSHIITWPGHFQPHYNILHAIIMLIDNELKLRLNKKGKYFEEGKICTESPTFLLLEKKILPYWKKYLAGKLGKNILELKKFLIKNRNKIELPKT